MVSDIKLQPGYRFKVIWLMSAVAALAFMQKFLFFYSFFVPYFMHIGITPLALGVAMSTFEISKILADVPTGLLADKYGRKYVLVGGFITMAMSLAAWMYMPNFKGAVLGMVLYGISKVSFYGKFESYFYDEMKVLKCEDRFHKLMSSVSIVANLGAAGSGFIALKLFNSGGYELVYKVAFSMIVFGILPFFVFLMPNSPIPISEESKKKGRQGAIKILCNAFVYLKNDRKLMFTTVLTALAFTTYILIAEVHRMVLKDIGATQAIITTVYGTYHVSQVVSAMIVSMRKKPSSSMLLPVKYLMFLMSCVIVSSFFYGYITVGILLIYVSFWPFLEVKVKTGLHDLAKSDVRATLASFCTITSSMFNGIFSVVIGAVSQHYTYKGGIAAYGGLMLIICIVLYFFGRRVESKS